MNRKIIDYCLVQEHVLFDNPYDISNPLAEIEEDVKAKISEGWQPLGGISVSSETDMGGRRVYTQALVRCQEDEEEWKRAPFTSQNGASFFVYIT